MSKIGKGSSLKIGKDVISSPKGYYKGLQQITSGKQQQFYLWMLEKGKSFKGRKLAKEEEDYFERILGKKLYSPKHCFYNAQMIAISDSSFQYYEGQAKNKKVPVLTFEHAWLVKDGKVYDPTWKDGTEYHGIHIPTNLIRSHIAKTGRADSLLIEYYSIL